MVLSKKTLKSLESSDKLVDVASFLLANLFHVPDYRVVSVLSYLLTEDQIVDFCSLFGGKTIKIPTVKELSIAISSILLYCNVNCCGGSYKDELEKFSENKEEIEEGYIQLLKTVENYEITKDLQQFD